MAVRAVVCVVFVVVCSSVSIAGQQPPPAAPKGVIAPDQHLPPHIRKLTGFGERAEFSLDGTRVLFLSKTFGDAMEIDLATGVMFVLDPATNARPHPLGVKAAEGPVPSRKRLHIARGLRYRPGDGQAHELFERAGGV